LLRHSFIASWVVVALACSDDVAPMDDGGMACTTDSDCTDSIVCNGEERCMPGAPTADERGCVPGEFPCADGESCDEETGECTPGCVGDEDGDGFDAIACGGDDCDDSDANRYPGNTEVCDEEGVDEDCDPSTLGDDEDGDGYVSRLCCNSQADDTLLCGEDCDDTLEGVAPGRVDGCNGVDDDCDGDVDEDPTFTFYRDVDGDNSGDPDVEVQACSRPDGFASDAGDCDDMDEQINPGATERCQAELIDDDCDGTANEGCSCTTGATQTCGPPQENTGNCMTADQACVDGMWPETCVGAVYPDDEVCDGGDEDCDGMIDEAGAADAITIYRDRDGDGYGVLGETMQSCTVLSGWSDMPGDCDDDAVLVRPGVADVCDGIDNDCDGDLDPGCLCENGTSRPCPAGLDEIGDCEQGTETCAGGVWGDCVGETLPSDEMCGAGDEDCDGMTDEAGAADAQTYYADGDGDMYGDATISQVACSLGTGWVLNSTDCDDTSSAINPLAAEVCDGIDNNCVSGIDENPAAASNSCGSLPPDTTATCSSAMCTITGCPSGFDDCVNGFSDFCETDLTSTLDRCGDCSTGCTFDCNASACNDLVAIDAGGTHTCALTEQGFVACWGANDRGQLGTGNVSPSTSPVLVSNIDDAIQVSAGVRHTCAIRAGGQAVCWGESDNGRLGTAGSDRTTPVSVPFLTDAAHIDAGSDHTCAARSGGTAGCFGAGSFGQIGNGGTSDVPSITPVVEAATSNPLTGVAEVAAGAAHSCALTGGGSVYCWGVNLDGQVGDGVASHGTTCFGVDCATEAEPVSGLSDATMIAAGNAHTCAVRMGGTIVCWGSNNKGQLGNTSAGASSDVPITVTGISDAVEVAAGFEFTCARRAGGQVLCWGEGEFGRLGTGDQTSRDTPTAIMGGLVASHLGGATSTHACLLDASGAAWCWGDNTEGKLGDGSTAMSTSPTDVLPL
jgi:alpha-tubulin suppressor-like RCC1 family protein